MAKNNLRWVDMPLTSITIYLKKNYVLSLACKNCISIYTDTCARGVMVIVVGNGHGNTSSNPGRDWLHFT